MMAGRWFDVVRFGCSAAAVLAWSLPESRPLG